MYTMVVIKCLWKARKEKAIKEGKRERKKSRRKECLKNDLSCFMGDTRQRMRLQVADIGPRLLAADLKDLN